METEILIFDIPDSEVIINKSQKELEYELLQKDSIVSKYHFESFYDMEITSDANKPPVSNISSVLCNYLLKYFTPIISNNLTADDYYISVQSNIPIDAIENDKNIVVPKNTPLKLIGFAANDLCYRKYDMYQLVHYDHISVYQLSQLGSYGIVNLQTGRFTQQRHELNHYGLIADKAYMFKNEADTIDQANLLMTYINQMETYYSENYLTALIELKSLIHHIKQKNINWSFEYNNLDDIGEINKIQHRQIGKSYTLDAQIAMEVDGSIGYYYYGKYLGLDSGVFKKHISDKLHHDEIMQKYIKQINEGFTKKLELNKKQTIAYHKYNIDNLEQLDKKQLAVVDLEYNRIEKISSKSITQRGKELQALFTTLRISLSDVTNERIKKTIDEIHKLLTKEELTSEKILEGGVCLHTLSYAEETIRLFNKIELNQALQKMLIEKYSLPKDTSGYFCKICGEQLIEADNQEISLFTLSDRNTSSVLDDHIQTMIWKETQYIVSTYVKFNVLIPVRPLINSIVSGLVDVIIAEEIKLYKNKTNTYDNVQNILIVYINIYIYAVLCAMMMNNLNKIIFGKDKPNDSKENNKHFSNKKFSKGEHSKSEKHTVSAAAEYHDTNELFGSLNTIDDGYLADSSEKINTTKKVNTIKKSKKHKRRNKIMRYTGDKTKPIGKYIGGVATNDIKMYERYILTTALNLILVTKDLVIKRLVNLTPDVIKQTFLKTAYVWARNHSRPIKFQEVSNNVRIKTIVDTDPFYTYIYNFKIMNKESVKFSHIKDILNRSGEDVDNDIKKNINVYSTVQVPKYKGSSNYDKYIYDSFMSIYTYISEDIFRKDTVITNDYYEQYSHIKKLEKEMYYTYAISRIRPMFAIDWLNDITKYNDFRPERIDLAQHYCTDGSKHKIHAYVYSYKNETITLTASEIHKLLESDEKLKQYAKYKLIDEECSLCKKRVRFNQSTEKSDKSLVSMFKKIDNVLAFYQYYDTRCPIGDLHDIVDNICTKCGINTEFKKTVDNKYYEKYLSKFKEIEHEKLSLSIVSLEQAQIKYPVTKLKPSVYKINLSLVAEWSQIANIKYNILVNIGLTEGYKFIDIEKSRVNPSNDLNDDANNMNKTRSMKIKNYIFAILREYNQLLNWENIVDMPLELKEIINNQKKIGMNRIAESIPNISDEFKQDAIYKYTLTNAEYANWLLEYLAGIFVNIYKKTVDTYKQFAHDIILYFTNYIISQEQLFAKAPPLVFKATPDAKDESDSDEMPLDENVAQTQSSASEFEDDAEAKKNEVYENEINDEAFDVEDAAQVWELE